MRMKLNLDALGIGASLLCAVHCVLLPIVIAALPLMGLEVLENEKLEYLLMAVSFFIGYTALFRGYRRHHGHARPLWLFSAGFAGLLAGHFWLHDSFWGLAVIFLGATLIVWAHVINMKVCKSCKVCSNGEAGH